MTGEIRRRALSPRMATRNDPMIPWGSYKWPQGQETDDQEQAQFTREEFERALRKASQRRQTK